MARVDLAHLRRALAKGAPAAAYYLHGGEGILKDEALAAILGAALEPGTRDFNLDLLSAQDIDPGAIAGACAVMPMMAERRAVVVRDVEAWKRKNKAKGQVVEYLERPIAGAVLVLIQGNGDDPDDALAAHCVVGRLHGADRRPAGGVARRAAGGRRRGGDVGRAGTPAARHRGRPRRAECRDPEAWRPRYHGGDRCRYRGCAGRGALRRNRRRLARRGAARRNHHVPWRWFHGFWRRAAYRVSTWCTLLGAPCWCCAGPRTAGGRARRAGRCARHPDQERAAVHGAPQASAATIALARIAAEVVDRWPLPRLRAATVTALDADVALKHTTISDEAGIVCDLVLAMRTLRHAAGRVKPRTATLLALISAVATPLAAQQLLLPTTPRFQEIARLAQDGYGDSARALIARILARMPRQRFQLSGGAVHRRAPSRAPATRCARLSRASWSSIRSRRGPTRHCSGLRARRTATATWTTWWLASAGSSPITRRHR